MTDADTTTTTADWQAWQKSWDRQQEWYLPDREERFRIMLDMVEALVGTAPRVLDLACGTGSITARLLARFPEATSTGVDLDPALLTIAEGTFAGDERVGLVTADLKDADWPAKLPYDSYDAVLTATALHWLHREPLADLYGQVAGVVRDGGVFMNADHMIDETTPRINAAERAQRHARMEPALRDLRRARGRRHAAGGVARARAAREGLRGGQAGVVLALGHPAARPEVARGRGRYGVPVPPPRRVCGQSTLDRNDFVRSCRGFVSTSRG
jgi:SAM-dependent methyltransferase